MATVQIYAGKSYWYDKTDAVWSDGRDSNVSDNVYSTSPFGVGVTSDGRNFTFFRIYLSFNLSSIPVGSSINNIRLYLKRKDTIKIPYTPIIAYAGSIPVDGLDSEFPLYIVNILRGESLSTITIDDDSQYYSSSLFNLVRYPVSPGDTLSIGIVDDYDFNNTVNSFSDLYQISNSVGVEPYIEVDYTAGGGGYQNNVMGVSSANISSVRGVLSANISKINVI